MPAMSLFSGNLFLLLCLELEVYVPSFILFNSCSQHWSGLQQFLKDVRSALRKGYVEETQPAETQPAEARGLPLSRVQSEHSVTGATMLRGIAVFFRCSSRGKSVFLVLSPPAKMVPVR